jgi:hypothetical protein
MISSTISRSSMSPSVSIAAIVDHRTFNSDSCDTLNISPRSFLSITICLIHIRIIADLSFFAGSISVRSCLSPGSRRAIFEINGSEEGNEEEETMYVCISNRNVLCRMTMKGKGRRSLQRKRMVKR